MMFSPFPTGLHREPLAVSPNAEAKEESTLKRAGVESLACDPAVKRLVQEACGRPMKYLLPKKTKPFSKLPNERYRVSRRYRSRSASARRLDGGAGTKGSKLGLSAKMPNIGTANCSPRFSDFNPKRISIVRNMLS
jgi:hypothetical protein